MKYDVHQIDNLSKLLLNQGMSLQYCTLPLLDITPEGCKMFKIRDYAVFPIPR
jgi:hypothetical protein